MQKKLLLLIMLFENLAYASNDAGALSRKDVLSWPRTKADKFGCFLEKSFGYRDRKFNCGLTGYINQGDPCKNFEAYYEGPKFPSEKANLVHPLIQSIELSWEHGDLQAVDITLNKKLDEQEVRKQFNLPKNDNHSRPNIRSISIQQCSLKATCLIIQGFDHMGAGDVDCAKE